MMTRHYLRTPQRAFTSCLLGEFALTFVLVQVCATLREAWQRYQYRGRHAHVPFRHIYRCILEMYYLVESSHILIEWWSQ